MPYPILGGEVMKCEEHLEIFENGFEDGKFNLKIEYYGKNARRVLLAVIFELYSPIYGTDYVYPFECAKEFWGVYIEPSEIVPENLNLSKPKFITRPLIDKAKSLLNEIEAPEEIKKSLDIETSEIYKFKEGLLVIGRNFLIDGGKKILFVFNKPHARELLIKYLRR